MEDREVYGSEQPPIGSDPVLPSEYPGMPREQYRRVYVLMPPDTTMAMADAATYAVFPGRLNVGYSADDAGIGALDDKTVVVVNPNSWNDDIEEFFRRYYPDTKYVPIEASSPYQLQGRLAAIAAMEKGIRLAYPTTHTPAVETSAFGVWRETYYHNGCDLRSSASAWGDEIIAALSGEVVWAGENPNEPWFGIQVKTRRPVGDLSVFVRYAHFVDEQLPVTLGSSVRKGDFIGRPDNTGTGSRGDHLHIDVKLTRGNWWSYADPRILFSEWPE